jgi:hypothetical protein
MILLDFSQIISACIYVGDAHECAKHPSLQSKNMIKHSIINSVRQNYTSHKARYGKMILACDYGSWRYDVFPQYKHSRKLKKLSDTSGINWSFIDEIKAEIISDFDSYFPFPVIKIKKCEGDDIIGVLTKMLSELSCDQEEENIFGEKEVEKILIISTDKDNFQLHKWKNVSQYSPVLGKFIKPELTPKQCILEKIVKGDVGDGVMNIKMSDNTFVDGIRQKPIAQTFLNKFYESLNPIDICEDEIQKTNYIRNEQLVSYEKIPDNISDSIILCYDQQVSKKHSKSGLFNYFIENSMVNLVSQIHDFY